MEQIQTTKYGNHRTQIIAFKLTDKEKIHLVNKSVLENIPLSQYIRQRILPKM